MRYDLVVIGSDPEGQKGALAAARLGKRVALIECRENAREDAGFTSSTIPSRILRDAIVHLTEVQQANLPDARCAEGGVIAMRDLRRQVTRIINREAEVLHDQLVRNGIDLYPGEARFAGPHEIWVEGDGATLPLDASHILLACGTRPARPANIPLDGRHVFDSDGILELDSIPRSLIVVGAGVTGIEQAFLFAALGVDVTVVDGRESLLDFCDRDVVDVLLSCGRSLGFNFHFGEDVIGLDRMPGNRIALQLAGGKRLIGENVLYAAGRVGDTAGLNLPAAGLEPDERGRLWCDEYHRTWVPHIYGVGAAVGFPALARHSRNQGRRAIGHAFGLPFPGSRHVTRNLYTIPEIAMVGMGEDQLTKERVPFEVGIVRAGNEGDRPGLLKVLFHRATRRVLGMRCIGEQAIEIVRIGESVMTGDGTIEDFREAVFDDSVMAEFCQVAGDGLSGLELTGPSEVADLDLFVAGRAL
ncbi:MAG: FAD-dependent oxidoreductase [Deltaproteobacteria bacterium]